MKLKDIYNLAIELGKEADPRGSAAVDEFLARQRKAFQELKEKEKEEVDKEKLNNPYCDTRILFGDEQLEVKSLMVGIDIEIGEVILADRLREKGKRIDLLVAHHPEGYALAGFYEVMGMQADILNKFGVPINIAEDILKERIEEVHRKVLPVNHQRAVDAAKLLDLPFICIHTPADNLVTSYLQKRLDEEKPYTIKDICDFLKSLPEYKEATLNANPPTIICGDGNNRAGKIFVEMTGGTEGTKRALQYLATAGVGTIVAMHYSEELREEAKKNHINVIIAGHMASDTLGMNLLLDELIKREPSLEIIPTSGFKRFSYIS